MKKEIGELVDKLDEIAELLVERLDAQPAVQDQEAGPSLGDLERVDRELAKLQAKFDSLQRLAKDRIQEFRIYQTDISRQLSTQEKKLDDKLTSFFAALQSIEERLNKFEAFMQAVTAGSPLPIIIPSLVP